MTDHGGMALAEYLIDALQRGRKFTSASVRWDGQDDVTIRVKDQHGGLWRLHISSSPDDDA